MVTAPRLLLAAAALLLPAAAPAQDASAESSSPWNGLLPDPDQGRGSGDRGNPEWLACRVLDGTTGLPVAGARFRRYPEWNRGATLRHSYLLGEGTTDADGFARVPALLHFHDGDSHWIVDAPGYAPAHHFGAVPEETVMLRRGEELRGRVLDALGKPAAGATVELFLGCGHSPAVRTAGTSDDGRFTLPCVPPGEGTLWILTPAGAADYVNLGPTLAFGDRPADFVLAPGATATGRVIDAAGDPIPGATVRSWQEQRGPAAVTGLDGAFTLEGVEPGHDFQVFHPSPVGEDRASVGRGWLEEIPVVVRMTAAGPLDPPARDGTLVVRAHRPDGKPAADVEFAAARVEDGGMAEGTTSDGKYEDDLPAGEARLPVAAGTWFIRPESRFGEGNFEPTEAIVPKDGTGEATVVLLPPARLRIKGDLPKFGVSLRLSIPGESIIPDDKWPPSPWEPLLPRDSPATLWIEPLLGYPLAFPVGPVDAAGVREVTVSIPPPHRIRLPEWASRAALFHGAREVAAGEVDGQFLTRATGRLVLRVEDGKGRTREAALDLPADRAVDLDAAADLEAAKPLPVAAVRFLGPDGAPVEPECAALEANGRRSGWNATSGITLETPRLLVARLDGWVPRTLFLDRGGPVEVRWGGAAMEFSIRRHDGEPADALVLAGGVVVPAPEGRLALGGFEPGTHELIVGFRDEPGGGRRLRVALKAGETRRLEVVLGDDE